MLFFLGVFLFVVLLFLAFFFFFFFSPLRSCGCDGKLPFAEMNTCLDLCIHVYVYIYIYIYVFFFQRS